MTPLVRMENMTPTLDNGDVDPFLWQMENMTHPTVGDVDPHPLETMEHKPAVQTTKVRLPYWTSHNSHSRRTENVEVKHFFLSRNTKGEKIKGFERDN